jgi:hypothetical protein
MPQFRHTRFQLRHPNGSWHFGHGKEAARADIATTTTTPNAAPIGGYMCRAMLQTATDGNHERNAMIALRRRFRSSVHAAVNWSDDSVALTR